MYKKIITLIIITILITSNIYSSEVNTISFSNNRIGDINKDNISNLLPIEEYFDIIKISEEDHHNLIKYYSHGMKNKVQMLCFLITRPPIILLDEPLASFDVVVALEIKNLLKKIKSDHIIIFSTHILQLAVDLCDEIVTLNNGVLEPVDKELLKSQEFEERIMEILKEEIYD